MTDKPKHVKKAHPKHVGVHQRCLSTCPDRCGVHSWSWYAQVTVDGRRTQLTSGGHPTAKAAHQAREAELAALRDGRKTIDTTRLGPWLDVWVAQRIKLGKLRPTTARSYQDIVRNHLAPRLGDVRLADLTPNRLTDAYLDIRDRQADGTERTQPLTPTTIAKVHAVLRGALTAAVRNQLIPANPAIGAELPAWTQERREIQPWTVQQFGQFITRLGQMEGLSQMWAALYDVAGIGGLRRGELLGLRWADIDLDSGVVSVQRQRVQDGAYTAVNERTTKTRAGRRTAFIPTGLRSLAAWRDRQAQIRADLEAIGYVWPDADGHVFTHEDGRPLHPEQATKTFSKLARRAGLPVCRLHDLRHFTASLHLEAGSDMTRVSKMLGHSSVAITTTLYTHLQKKVGQSTVTEADRLIDRDDQGAL